MEAGSKLKRIGRVCGLMLFVLVLSALGGCKSELYTNITEPEANEMVAVLAAGGMRSAKVSPDGKTWSVLVEESDIPKALSALRAQGLPRDRTQSLGDIFKKEGLVSTPSEERIRFIYAISQELSHTLAQIDGVITARVHVVIPANDPLAERIIPSSASVFIKHRPSLNTKLISAAVKTLVHRSIEGLTYENIGVVFFPADTFQETVPPDNPFDLKWYEWAGVVLLGALLIMIALPGGRALIARPGTALRGFKLSTRLRSPGR
ncbi:MAG TPA: type III secretion inner membrane ring lipoprotein SctJ [Noviherbaspirillum sp.]|nr:type III secretion inner membrane ring lipoprotein SctJ [Noviherbaspirillum sp.]